MKSYLDALVARYNTKDFIENDPVQFPHRFDRLQDQEIVGLLIAIISWGKRSMILNNAEKMLALMDNKPYEFIQKEKYESLPNEGAMHRTFQMIDFKYICRGLNHIYKKVDSLESFFIGKDDLFDGIEEMRNAIIEGNNLAENYSERSLKHIAAPSKKSACKRINMFLRWMVRNDGVVDLGVWTRIRPSKLYIPLDTHVIQSSKKLGLLSRTQNDIKSVKLLTEKLYEFCPEDPIKYDFALFGVGVNNDDINLPESQV